MFLRDSRAIRTAIQDLVAGHRVDEPIGLAVAFWGSGAEGELPSGRRYRVICNLNMGGTNPQVIAQLMERPDVEVRHLPELHAKVVVTAGGAVVSSANFSANGLGLEGASSGGWLEAGVLMPADDAEFVQVYGWFAQQWRTAAPVTAQVLELATRQWQPRAVQSQEAIEVPVIETPPAAAVDVIPELKESDLFLAKLGAKHMIRMAAPWLVEEYGRLLGSPLAPTDNFIPAYAANLLWTVSGKKIPTGIKSTPEFWRPGQVLERAAERGAAFPDRARNLIAHLARSPKASDAIRYWAQRFADMKL